MNPLLLACDLKIEPGSLVHLISHTEGAGLLRFSLVSAAPEDRSLFQSSGHKLAISEKYGSDYMRTRHEMPTLTCPQSN